LDAVGSGRIGTPFAATATWGSPGPESWHPSPQFFFLRGGGPVLDMGPYYVTALVTHLGPVTSVVARAVNTERHRSVGSGPLAGTELRVETPTYATAILEHASGALSTVTLSFETWASGNALLEIQGTEGTLALPDPNWFSEAGRIFEAKVGEWRDLTPSAGYVEAGRGYGLAEMVEAIEQGRDHRASGDLALHVLEVLSAINQSGVGDGPYTMTTAAVPPAAVPLTAWQGEL
jgi:predicted dehydrogenase